MVMDELGLAYDVISPDIDEKAIREADPEKLVLAIAHAKADAVSAQVKEPSIVIASDQVVVWNGQIREKPVSKEQAREFIKSYGKQPATIINGMVVTNTKTGKRAEGLCAMHIWYNPISDADAASLAEYDGVMDCAGALRSENPAMMQFMSKTDGSFDIARGLPKKLLGKLLQEIK